MNDERDEQATPAGPLEEQPGTTPGRTTDAPEPYAALAPDGLATDEDALADPDAIEAALDVEGGADELAKESSTGAEAVVGRWRSPIGRLARTVLAFIAFFVIVALVWELFKWLFGDPWRFEDILGTGIAYFHEPPFELLQASDRQLPHVWDIAYALTEPVQRTSETALLVHLLGAAASTFTMALIGFGIGALIGVALASIFVHSALSERAVMPYVIASQAIPIVALAPIIVVAAGRGNAAVIFIAVYLTFFPVTVAQTRGLRAPDPRSLELMRSMAASKWDIYRKVRLPASVPYLFTALKIAAAAAIVGAIVGEGPGGVRDGLGRALLNYNQYYSSGPEKLWATILIASLTGIFFFTCVRIAEILSTRRRGRNASAGDRPASGVAVKGA
jgi:NitT/TauT family transport system permease protein